jgi:hypothetical protein
MSKATIVCIALSIAACASGGAVDSDGNKIDAAVSSHDDASNVTTPDAKVRMDAGVTPHQDAQVSQLPQDAPAQQGPFCTANNQCTTAGECCVTLGGPSGFCAPGSVVLGQCFPQ